MTELLTKAVRSTTLERLRKTVEADLHVQGMSQPLQLGQGLYHLLDHIDLPVESTDLIVGRILEEVPDDEGEAFFQTTVAAWNGRAIAPWMQDGGHECFAWQRLLDLGLVGLEEYARAALDEREARRESEATLDFLRGAIGVYQAFRNYARRYDLRSGGWIKQGWNEVEVALRRRNSKLRRCDFVVHDLSLDIKYRILPMRG